VLADFVLLDPEFGPEHVAERVLLVGFRALASLASGGRWSREVRGDTAHAGGTVGSMLADLP
jgi:hypothetical protein